MVFPDAETRMFNLLGATGLKELEVKLRRHRCPKSDDALVSRASGQSAEGVPDGATLPKVLYKVGIKNRFMTVDDSNPPTITTAIGYSISCPGRFPATISGNNANAAVKAVISSPNANGSGVGVILTPREANDTTIALASWARLLTLNDYDPATVRDFVETNRGQAPEGSITP